MVTHTQLQQPDILETFHNLQENTRLNCIIAKEKHFVTTNILREWFKMPVSLPSNLWPLLFQKTNEDGS